MSPLTVIQDKTAKRALLRYAEQAARAGGQRWTETRAQVYETLLGENRPATAYALAEKAGMKPMSVYRALDALCDMGLAARIESLNAFVACRHPQHAHEHVFLVCDSCGKTDEVESPGVSPALLENAAARGFQPRRQTLELHGACEGCQHV